mmetsp:Transcript_52802/g.170187  ORF Transcript_52802/g.170187 Transcript_52802/m.170187 type:complete len:351 (+) Transcript_52802:207-1259(+)
MTTQSNLQPKKAGAGEIQLSRSLSLGNIRFLHERAIDVCEAASSSFFAAPDMVLLSGASAVGGLVDRGEDEEREEAEVEADKGVDDARGGIESKDALELLPIAIEALLDAGEQAKEGASDEGTCDGEVRTEGEQVVDRLRVWAHVREHDGEARGEHHGQVEPVLRVLDEEHKACDAQPARHLDRLPKEKLWFVVLVQEGRRTGEGGRTAVEDVAAATEEQQGEESRKADRPQKEQRGSLPHNLLVRVASIGRIGAAHGEIGAQLELHGVGRVVVWERRAVPRTKDGGAHHRHEDERQPQSHRQPNGQRRGEALHAAAQVAAEQHGGEKSKRKKRLAQQSAREPCGIACGR